MSITPIGPSGPSAPSPPPSSPPSSPTTSDVQSTYSNDIATGKKFSIVGFSSLMLETAHEGQELAWKIQQDNANSRKDFYNALIRSTLSAVQVYTAIFNVQSEYSSAFNQNKIDIQALNTKLTAYNHGNVQEQNQINAVNAAINLYNSGGLSQAALQAAINTYNTYVTARNLEIDQTNAAINTFNQNVSITNGKVIEVNEQLDILGIDPLPGQSSFSDSVISLVNLPNAPSNPPAQGVTIVPQTTNLAINTMNTMGAGDGTALFNSLLAGVSNLMSQFTLTSNFLQIQSSFHSFIQFHLQGNLPYLPPAFYTLSPKVSLSSGASGTGAGTGVSAALLVIGLSSPLMEGIISQAIFRTNVNVFNQPQTSKVVNELSYLGLQLLSQIGLQAGSPALRLIGDRLPFVDLRASPVALALGLAVTSEIGSAISQKVVSDGIKEILSNAYPDISATDLNSLTLQLASSIELFMLQAGVNQLAQVLNYPQLPGQLISTSQAANPNQLTNGDIIKNQTLTDSISASIAKETNLSFSQANEITQSAITAASINSESDQEALTNSYIASGLDSQQAVKAAQITHSYLQSEIRGREILDAQVKNNQLSQTVLANDYVNEIVANQPTITNRQLRDQLITDFTANGATSEQAISTATAAITGTVSNNPITLEGLKQSLYDKALSGVSGLNLSDPSAFATELVNTVLGPATPGSQTSIRELINERLNTLVQSNDAKSLDNAKSTILQSLAPTLELYNFAERLRDPANTFLLCAQTGLMYSHSQPSNYKNSVDIQV